MVAGGTTTLCLELFHVPLPLALDANIFGILVSFLAYVLTEKVSKRDLVRIKTEN